MRKAKYNLSFWQRCSLVFLFPVWLFTCLFNSRAKSWHEVKSGMEKHIHKMDWIYLRDGQYFVRCSHDGCNKTELLHVPEL